MSARPRARVKTCGDLAKGPVAAHGDHGAVSAPLRALRVRLRWSCLRPAWPGNRWRSRRPSSARAPGRCALGSCRSGRSGSRRRDEWPSCASIAKTREPGPRTAEPSVSGGGRMAFGWAARRWQPDGIGNWSSSLNTANLCGRTGRTTMFRLRSLAPTTLALTALACATTQPTAAPPPESALLPPSPTAGSNVTSATTATPPPPAVAPIADPNVASAMSAAQSWLALVDAEKYGESWSAAASIFKSAVTEAIWDSAAAGTRGPLGSSYPGSSNRPSSRARFQEHLTASTS